MFVLDYVRFRNVTISSILLKHYWEDGVGLSKEGRIIFDSWMDIVKKQHMALSTTQKVKFIKEIIK